MKTYIGYIHAVNKKVVVEEIKKKSDLKEFNLLTNRKFGPVEAETKLEAEDLINQIEKEGR